MGVALFPPDPNFCCCLSVELMDIPEMPRFWDVCVCAGMCGTQKSALCVVLQILSTVFFETGSLTDLEFTKSSRLAG